MATGGQHRHRCKLQYAMTINKGHPTPSIAEQIRTGFKEMCRRGYSEARAIELVAIDLGLSINDCINVIRRDDLTAQITDHWKLEFPTVGPPAMKRRW